MAGRDWALVTGASGGIGADLARELARDGHNLVLAARGRAAMEQLAGELRGLCAEAEIEAVDLLAPGAVAALVQSLSARGRQVDVLVNNAGFGDTADFAQADPAKILGIVQLNMAVPTELMRALLPAMKARGKGKILNVASTAAFQPGPGMAVYCATKAYLLSLSEAVAWELRGSGVTVTALCPGPTHTGFAKVAGTNALFSKRPIPVMSAAAVARIGYRALQAGKRVKITGLVNAIGARSAAFTPRALLLRISNALLAGH